MVGDQARLLPTWSIKPSSSGIGFTSSGGSRRTVESRPVYSTTIELPGMLLAIQPSGC
jgi:hypothetical protein